MNPCFVDGADKRIGDFLAKVEPEDLLKFGLIPEFIGRLPVTVTLQELDLATMIQILTEPKNALTKQYQKLFELDGADLSFTHGALEAVAEKARQKRTGARALRSIMEQMMLEIMYEMPSIKDTKKGYVITREMVESADSSTGGIIPLLKAS